jgi:protein-arginine kinase activator protein McsA
MKVLDQKIEEIIQDTRTNKKHFGKNLKEQEAKQKLTNEIISK